MRRHDVERQMTVYIINIITINISICVASSHAVWGFPDTMWVLVLVFYDTVPYHFIMVALGLAIKWPAAPSDWIKNWRAMSSIFYGLPNGQTFQRNSIGCFN
jgi:hypothetical protein